MGVGFLLDSPLIVFHSMCVFRLWSQCPSRCSFHMPDLCVCMAWLMSLFKCSSLLSVGSFALIMSRSFICALMFSGSRGLLGLILPFYEWCSRLHRFCQLVVTSFIFVCVRIPSGVMRINISNNKRHFVVAEEVRDRCVVTSAATGTWQNVDVQLLAIGHCDRNALLFQMRIG